MNNNEICYTASEKLTGITGYYYKGAYVYPFNTKITSHTFSKGKGVIKFNGDVTSIGSSAFYKSSGLTSVTIPNSVTSIGDFAFAGCGSLRTVSIPKTTKVNNYVFSGCPVKAELCL